MEERFSKLLNDDVQVTNIGCSRIRKREGERERFTK
jgi:hypothetical protein